jgi:hypothetical protein
MVKHLPDAPFTRTIAVERLFFSDLAKERQILIELDFYQGNRILTQR